MDRRGYPKTGGSCGERRRPYVASFPFKSALKDILGHAESIIKISAQLVIALSLIQGIGMLHPPSKEFLGRKFSLEVGLPPNSSQKIYLMLPRL